VITGASWNDSVLDVEGIIRSALDKACGDLGPGCVDYEVVVDFDPEFPSGVDCPVREVRFPEPTYDIDIVETPYRDDLVTIAINDPCDGVVVPPSPPDAESS
jgi:hypothetical protein